MEFLCEACRVVIQIPEEKVPTNNTFRLTCPRCKSKIHVSTKIHDGMRERSTSGSAVVDGCEDSAQSREGPGEIWGEKVDSPNIDQAAVLLCSDYTEVNCGLKSMLEKMGYAVDMPVIVDQAIDQLRLNQYQVVILSEHFGGKFPSPVASYLAGLNMHIRRDMFVILVGERYKTADPLQSFVESVNLVVHPADVPRMEMILSKGLENHARFYKVFIECLIEAGKRV